jgi:hypothetical protein
MGCREREICIFHAPTHGYRDRDLDRNLDREQRTAVASRGSGIIITPASEDLDVGVREKEK